MADEKTAEQIAAEAEFSATVDNLSKAISENNDLRAKRDVENAKVEAARAAASAFDEPIRVSDRNVSSKRAAAKLAKEALDNVNASTD